MKRYILVQDFDDKYKIIDTYNDEYVYEDEKYDYLCLEIEEPYEDEIGCKSRYRYEDVGFIIKESNNIKHLEKLLSEYESNS